jgi:hypothetical protein
MNLVCSAQAAETDNFHLPRGFWEAALVENGKLEVQSIDFFTDLNKKYF